MSKLNWKAWFYGLLAGAIGGAASAALSWGGLAAAHGAGVDVPVLNFKALGIVLLSGALPSFFAYLKQSPLPAIVTQTTTTVTLKETHQTEAAPVDKTTETKPMKETQP